MRRTLFAVVTLPLLLAGCMKETSIQKDLDKRGTLDLMKEVADDKYTPPKDGRLTDAQVQMYLDVVGKLDPTIELAPGESAPLEKFVLAGTPEDVAEHARTLYDAGAHRVEFGTPQGLTTRGGVELLCDHVLPLLA